MKIVIAAESEELAGLIQYISDQEPDIEVIYDVENLDDLPALVAETQPDWLFVLQRDLAPRHDGLAIGLLALHPPLTVLLMSDDGHHRTIRCNDDGQPHEHTWDEFSTSEFIHLLRTGQYPQATNAEEVQGTV